MTLTYRNKIIRHLYAKAHVLKRWFSVASLHAKCMLFNAYCTPMYGCQLWNSAYEYNFKRLKTAYNDAFRVLLNVPRWTSASVLFASHGIPFTAVIRKSVFSISAYVEVLIHYCWLFWTLIYSLLLKLFVNGVFHCMDSDWLTVLVFSYSCFYGRRMK